MRLPPLPIVLAGAALAMAAGAADAYICYVVLDAKDAVAYRDTRPPVDMSDQGAAARNALRRTGQYLMIVEVDQCFPVGSPAGSNPASPANVADFVSGVRPLISSADAAAAVDGRAASAGVPAAAPAARTEPAPAPTAVRRRSSTSLY